MLDSSSTSSSNNDEHPAFGDMFLSLTLGANSLTGLVDENPINIFDFFRNIGGFWGECTSPSRATNVACRRMTQPGAINTLVANCTHCPDF